MATNVRDTQTRDEIHNEALDTRTADRPGEPVPVARPVGGSGVAVYDRNPAQPLDPTLRPATPANPRGSSMADDRMLVEPRSTGSIIGWLIGAVILIVLAYFLLQMFF